MIRAGDVVVLEFRGATGVKRRPAVVLSSEFYHRTRPDLILGLITGKIQSADSPSDYVLKDWNEAGLRVPSVFRSFLLTAPRAEVIYRIGSLSDRDWEQVCEKVRSAIAGPQRQSRATESF